MISIQRLEANRRNALRSTGPRTEDGKQRSRINAVRHGLTAETVVGSLEDAEDYKAFEAAIIADYDAETAVARELVLRLASLYGGFAAPMRLRPTCSRFKPKAGAASGRNWFAHPEARTSVDPAFKSPLGDENREWQQSNDHLAEQYKKCVRGLTHSFLRLAKMDSRAFERLNRYEVALWRQTRQTLFALHPRRYR